LVGYNTLNPSEGAGWLKALKVVIKAARLQNGKESLLKKKHDETLFSPGKARWLLDNVDKLDESQRALLLAIAELSKDTGRDLTEEERAVLEKLAAETQGFDPAEIQAAVQKMVEGEAKRKPIIDWPSDIGDKLKHPKKK
jgi:hypothetical protein